MTRLDRAMQYLDAFWNGDAQTDEIRALTRDTAIEMLRMEGFIGASFFRIGGRGVTISAWEKPEHVTQLRRGGTHAEAMRKFWGEVGDSAFTSVRVPDRINTLWVRCTACRKMNDYDKQEGVCGCGQRSPDAPAYF